MNQTWDYDTFSFESATQTGLISGRVYYPQITGDAAACVQIIHGMAEHMARYDSFCQHLAQSGLIVCIHDQAGHGSSAASPDQLGYFGPVNGVDAVLDDIDTAYQKAQALLFQRSGRQSHTRFIFGHSMGSFISRLYCTRTDIAVAGAIFSGTAGPSPMVNPGRWIAQLIIRLKGPEYRSQFLEKLTSAGNLKRIPEAKTKYDWLTRDQEIVDAYEADPLCGYRFTAAGYRDLLTWLQRVSASGWAGEIPVDCSILIVSGDQDPIGQYGAGPRKVARNLKQTNHQVATLIYPGGRHESINEINRETVWQDITNWIQEQSLNQKAKEQS